jgi:hypothetical protein
MCHPKSGGWNVSVAILSGVRTDHKHLLFLQLAEAQTTTEDAGKLHTLCKGDHHGKSGGSD